MSEKKSTGEKRSSNWNFILYPESAPANWRELIDETHIEWVESPVHDKDLNPDGTEKKAHYHITLLFPSLKSFEQVEEITKSLNAPIPEKCLSVKGSIRYMAHKDNPDKHQYEWGGIVCHGGADLSSLCAPTATERLQIQKDIIQYIRENGVTEFFDMVNHAMNEGLDDWTNVLLNYSTMAINAYIKSQRHKFEQKEQ